MTRMGMLRHVFVASIGVVLGSIGWCRADEPWQVREFKLDWPKPTAGQSDSHSKMNAMDETEKEHKGTTHEFVFPEDGRFAAFGAVDVLPVVGD